MSIETTIIAYLADNLSVPVSGDRPNLAENAEFVTVEKLGSGLKDHLESASIAVQSWSDSRAAADALNETVKTVMAGMAALPEISRCALDTDYNFPDLDTKKARYQALFDVVYY